MLGVTMLVDLLARCVVELLLLSRLGGGGGGDDDDDDGDDEGLSAAAVTKRVQLAAGVARGRIDHGGAEVSRALQCGAGNKPTTGGPNETRPGTGLRGRNLAE